MKKLILLILVALAMVSYTPDYGDYVVITNMNYRAQSITIYYDYDDGYWTPIERIHMPAQYTTTFSADTNYLYKYAYKSSNMNMIKKVYSTHVRIY